MLFKQKKERNLSNAFLDLGKKFVDAKQKETKGLPKKEIAERSFL